VSDGLIVQQGHLVTARTGIDGILRVNVQAKTTEEITQAQQDALLTQLALLDPKAATPQQTLQGLQAMAQQYAWEVNLPFRQAVDIFVRDFRPMLLDTVNVRDNLDAWTYIDSAILAFAPVEGSGEESSVSATATLHLRALDWIGPFLESFLNLSRQSTALEDQLRDASKDATDTGALVNLIYQQAGKYVGSRFGKVGSYVGRKVAESSIRNFVDKELPGLDLDARIDLLPALNTASKTIATAEAPVLQGIVSTRQDITHAVDQKISKRIDPNLFNFGNRVGLLEAAMANKVDTTTFNNALATKVSTTTFNQAMATKVDNTTFNQALATKVDSTTFNSFQSNVDTRFTSVNTRFSDVDTRFTTVDTRLNTFNTSLTSIRLRLP